MESIEEKFNGSSTRERERTLYFFDLIYPNYSDMSSEDRWYAEWDKLIIADNLPSINLRFRRILRRDYTEDKTDAAREALRYTLTDLYSSFLEDDQWDFIADNLADVNKKFVDRRFYCMYNGMDFNPEEEMPAIVEQIKTEHRQKTINNNS